MVNTRCSRTNYLRKWEGSTAAKKGIQTHYQSQNLCTLLTEQLTQKCLYTPCQENAGTALGAAKGHRSPVGAVWMFPGMEETQVFFSFPHSSCTKVKAPLQLYSSSIRILAQNLAGPMAAVVKNAFPEEG